ncbi:MAG: hypothetical protein QG673_2284 [Pseudomonadota bacterium]|nr:hypothetical protein [Pseudomonadota bacterium]
MSVTLYDENGESQVIDHVLLDTGSSGFKVLKSQLNSSLTFSSILQGNNPESPISSCVTYGSGYMFGSNNLAGLQIGGQRADNVPIQIINDGSQSSVPDNCSSNGRFANLLQTSGARGILGVNPMTFESNSTLQNLIYVQTSSGFVNIVESSVQTLNVNPLSLLMQNNNGLIISYPKVSKNSTISIYGTMVMGLNTTSNNVIPSTIQSVRGNPNTNLGYFDVNENGWPVSGIFDSGTDTLALGGYNIPVCNDSSFCPSSPVTFSTIVSNYDGGESSYIMQTVSSVQGLGGYAVLPYWGTRLLPSSGLAVYGLPFFYGRNVYLGFYDSGTSTTPTWGYAANTN